MLKRDIARPIASADIDTPVGRLTVHASGGHVLAIALPSHDQALFESRLGPSADPATEPILEEVRRQLTDYFAGRRSMFDLPLEPLGTTFQRQVWDCVGQVRYGETASYREIACRVGRPQAVRAVGAANGANPLPIVIPCHRIIGSDGSLTGYGGGLHIKAWLLDLERSHA